MKKNPMSDIDYARIDLSQKLSDPIRGTILMDEISSEVTVMDFLLKNACNGKLSDSDFRLALIALLVDEGYANNHPDVWF